MRVVRTVHAWAGVALAVLAIVLGLSGALLVFQDDWIRATVPAARQGVDLSPVALGRALERLEATEAARLRSVTLAEPGLSTHRLYLKDEAGAYADQTGAVVQAWEKNGRAEVWLFDLHHHLLAGETGELVSGLAGIALSLMVLTGMIVWTPAWRASGWRVWPRSLKRSELVGSHRNLGLIFALPVFVLTLTGVAMVFSKEVGQLMGARALPKPPAVGSGDVDWSRAMAAAQSRFPEARPRMAIWPREPGQPASIRMKQPGEWHPNGRTTVFIDPATSEVVLAVDAMRLPDAQRAQNALYPVHSAAIGGRLYDALAFLSGLALAGLGGVGAVAFLRKPARRRKTTVPPVVVPAE